MTIFGGALCQADMKGQFMLRIFLLGLIGLTPMLMCPYPIFVVGS